jgi:hypothetical protein
MDNTKNPNPPKEQVPRSVFDILYDMVSWSGISALVGFVFSSPFAAALISSSIAPQKLVIDVSVGVISCSALAGGVAGVMAQEVRNPITEPSFDVSTPQAKELRHSKIAEYVCSPKN